MEFGLPIGLAIGALIAIAVLIALRLRRGRERVIGGGDSDPIQRAGAVASAPPVTAAPADATDKPAAAAPLANVTLDELLESSMLRKAVARAYESGRQDEVVQSIMRMTGIGPAEAKAFIEKVRRRGLDEA